MVSIPVILILNSCKKEKVSDKQLILSGKVVSNSECKSLKSARIMSDTPDTISCVNYSYNAKNNKLSMDHINAGFNCCYDSLYCTITQSGDTIIVQEFEAKSQCDCDCLFDLSIELNGVDAKQYQIKFIEPYCGDQEKLDFGIDLASSPEGSFSVTRKEYPWGLKLF